jgi:hypothetical protein
LHRDIVALGKRLEAAAAVEEAVLSQTVTRTSKVLERQHAELLLIIDDIKELLARIDDDIPLINLAITASGETLSSSMPSGISPSRLMQASTFISVGDTQFCSDPTRPVQIGPAFSVSLYMLFLGHSSGQHQRKEDWNASKLPLTPKTPQSAVEKGQEDEAYGLGEGQRKPIWQEVIHKARVRLCRAPLGWAFDRKKGYCPGSTTEASPENPHTAFGRVDEFSYHVEIIEDLDDGRLHDEGEAKHQPFDVIPMAGIRESVPIHQISKIFYTNTGRILNIGNSAENNPVLLLKRDVRATSPDQLREEWDEKPVGTNTQEDAEPATSESDDDDQSDIDRQLLQESAAVNSNLGENCRREERKWQFPKHVDREWFALEVYTEDDGDDSDDDEEDDEAEDPGYVNGESEATPNKQVAVMKPRLARDRSSVDSNLLEQIRNISIRSPLPASRQVTEHQLNGAEKAVSITDSPESFVARSPFGAITSSLSLMEMLIRLTSLQEFQQTSHLAIPDYILTFFLEETSTTGLTGEQRWKARSEAKRKVGFDPYTDTPSK